MRSKVSVNQDLGRPLLDLWARRGALAAFRSEHCPVVCGGQCLRASRSMGSNRVEADTFAIVQRTNLGGHDLPSLAAKESCARPEERRKSVGQAQQLLILIMI